jgi:hypothetical protein
MAVSDVPGAKAATAATPPVAKKARQRLVAPKARQE